MGNIEKLQFNEVSLAFRYITPMMYNISSICCCCGRSYNVFQPLTSIYSLFPQLDAVTTGDLTSGKDLTKARRKKLNSDVSSLQQTTQSLFSDISQKITDLKG